MVRPSVKEQLYERGLTISDIARANGVEPRVARAAVARWQGKTGNPRGKTRIILKYIEKVTGNPVYKEAIFNCSWDVKQEETQQWNG